MKLRIALAAFAGLVTLAGGGAAAAVATSGTAPAVTQAAAQTTYSAPRCYLGDLSAGLHGYQIEMGTRGFLLTLTNISNHSCTLYGYPGLQLLDAQKRPLPTKTQWGMSYFDRNQVKSLIVLSPGETASADISYGVYGTAANSVLAYCLEVTPPNRYGHFILKIPHGPALVYLHQVQVTPMARHTPYIP
jgi:hypothetical protein